MKHIVLVIEAVIGAVIGIAVTGTGTVIEIVNATTETATDVTVTEIGTATETAMEEEEMINPASGIMKVTAMTTLARREGIETSSAIDPIIPIIGPGTLVGILESIALPFHFFNMQSWVRSTHIKDR